MIKRALFLIGLSFYANLCFPQSQLTAEKVSQEVQGAVTRFLTAFENLDWETFRNSFQDDATVFFPVPEPPQMFDGRASYEKQFEKVFASIRASAPKGPPYQSLVPQNLKIKILAENVALV